MLCLVNEQEKQTLIKENKKGINIDFVYSEECFINQLRNDIFPVISVLKTENMCNTISLFSKVRFYLFFQDVGEIPLPVEVYSILLASNVNPNTKKRAVFNANELFVLFEGQDIID